MIDEDFKTGLQKHRKKSLYFIPSDYKCHRIQNIEIWFSPMEDDQDICLITRFFNEAYSLVLNAYPDLAQILFAVCVYNSCSEGCLFLNRKLSPTHLLVPYAVFQEGAICCFSPSIHTKNGNRDRMVRHFCHELIHIALTKLSGSRRVLGDQLKNLNIPVWIDEGISDYLALRLVGNDQRIQHAFDYYWQHQSIDLSIIEADLMNIEGVDISLNSYDWAVGKVASLIKDLSTHSITDLSDIFSIVMERIKDSSFH